MKSQITTQPPSRRRSALRLRFSFDLDLNTRQLPPTGCVQVATFLLATDARKIILQLILAPVIQVIAIARNVEAPASGMVVGSRLDRQLNKLRGKA